MTKLDREKQWLTTVASLIFMALALLVRPLSAQDAPEWIVMQDSPLPSGNQDILIELVKDRYELVSAFQAFSASGDLVYDQQDMFFVPFSGFEHVVRPGPNFSVFKRKDAATDGDARSHTH